jgi:hypothetical protein
VGKLNGRDEGEGIWLMDLIYEIEQRNLLELLSVVQGGAFGGDPTNIQCKAIWSCHNESPCTK